MHRCDVWTCISAANACWIVLCKCMLDIKCSVLRGWSCAITKSFEFWLGTVEKMGLTLSLYIYMMHLSPLVSSPPSCSYISNVASSKSLPQKSPPALLGTMKSFIFSNHLFFFALPFFLLVPNLDANHPLSLTLLHHPLIVLTPNSFQSSFNLLPHLLFPSSTSHTILFHERSSSPLLAQ